MSTRGTDNKGESKTSARRPGEQSPVEGKRDGYAEEGGQSAEDEPDVVLDIPVLKVEEVDLELDQLEAHVALKAELADLVKINVGVDAHLDNVKLNIKGVDAQALLKVRLDRVLDTFNRALESVDLNPQIVGETNRTAGQTSEPVANPADDEDEPNTNEGRG